MSSTPNYLISTTLFVLSMASDVSFAYEKIPCETASKAAYDIYSRVTTNAAFLNNESLSAAGEDLKIINKYSDNCEKVQEYISLLTSAVANSNPTPHRGTIIYSGGSTPTRGFIGEGRTVPELDLRLNSPVIIQRKVEVMPQSQ